MKISLQEINNIVKGELQEYTPCIITGIKSFQSAKDGDITFIADNIAIQKIKDSPATAFLITKKKKEETPQNINCIFVDNPRCAISQLQAIFLADNRLPQYISKKSSISKECTLGENLTIQDFVYISEKVIIGNNTVIMAGCFLGKGVRLGDNCVIHPNCVISEGTLIGNNVVIQSGTVIGACGFGYNTHLEEHQRLQHTGGVIIEDNVEIGALCAIDRGALDPTKIKKGSKLDNLIHIGHNVEIGENNLICAHCAIAGSSQTGNNVVLAGTAAIADHVRVGNKVTVGGASSVTNHVPDNSFVAGYPARNALDWKKSTIQFYRLPKIKEEIKELKNKIQALENIIKDE